MTINNFYEESRLNYLGHRPNGFATQLNTSLPLLDYGPINFFDGNYGDRMSHNLFLKIRDLEHKSSMTERALLQKSQTTSDEATKARLATQYQALQNNKKILAMWVSSINQNMQSIAGNIR